MEHTPERIIQVGMGFWAAKALLAATKLGLFTTLADKAMTGAELAGALGLHERSNPDFFDALVALQFLERDGNGVDATYRNSAETGLFLDRNSSAYMGGLLEMANDRLYPFWNNLIDSLQTGQAQNEAREFGESMFDPLYGDPQLLEQFMDAMSGVATGNFMALAEKFDFTPFATLCDIGGSAAALSRAVIGRHPHLRCISTDLPPVTEVTSRRLAEAGLDDRITATTLDFFKQPFPEADVITMGNILHDWNLDVKKMLIGKAFAALPKGGAFIVVENIIDDERRQNAFGLLMSLNMLVETADGFDFTGADFTSWCMEAGFSRTEIIPLTGPSSAAVAYK